VVSRDWVRRLHPHHPDQAAAVADLHALLLGAARFEIRRRSAVTPHLRGGDQADLAQQCADDALVAVLGKLAEFRGASRFTTWAYKFALLEAAVAVRRSAWQGREIPVVPDRWPDPPDPAGAAQAGLETRERLAAVGAAIDRDLSPHQREVLLALTVNDVPIDVLAERLGSTRGAIYKTLHDARRKLRAVLDGGGAAP
jgi:RNA polymerase sigma-70 factor (ECF subfamily)